MYQKLRSLPRFDKPTKLPVFKLPKYTGAQFRSAVKFAQETQGQATGSVNANAILKERTGLDVQNNPRDAEAFNEIRKEIQKQGLLQPQAPVEAEPAVEQEAEVFALPAPAVNVDR